MCEESLSRRMSWGAWKAWSLWLLCSITASQLRSPASRFCGAAEEEVATSLRALQEPGKDLISSAQASCGSGKGR